MKAHSAAILPRSPPPPARPALHLRNRDNRDNRSAVAETLDTRPADAGRSAKRDLVCKYKRPI
jgi:hypothetical protein